MLLLLILCFESDDLSSDLMLNLPFEVSNSDYNACECYRSGGTIGMKRYALRSLVGKDMMMSSKDLASIPCDKNSSHQRPRNQKNNVHVPQSPSAKSPQKRKFDQHINDGKLPTTFEPIGRKKSGNQNVKNLRRSQPSSLSCSSLSEEKMIILEQTQEYCSFCTQDYSHLSDSDDSSTGSNSMKQSNLESQTKDLNDSSSSYPFSTIKEKPSMKLVKVLKPILVNEDFVDGKTSHSLSSKEEDMELIDPPKNFLPSRGNHLPRPIIPIGPRFQAEVPKWEDTTNTKYLDGGDDLKWFGTQVLPMPFISKTNAKSIGKGRPNSCLCDFPRSIYCVQQHIREARELLKLEIGTAFSSWKFDDMGEDVSKSWTFKEQKKFESLVKLYSQSNDTDFWKLAMKHFPSKSMKCMINYYYNVYIPRRMSMETRSSFGLVNHEPKQGLQD